MYAHIKTGTFSITISCIFCISKTSDLDAMSQKYIAVKNRSCRRDYATDRRNLDSQHIICVQIPPILVPYPVYHVVFTIFRRREQVSQTQPYTSRPTNRRLLKGA